MIAASPEVHVASPALRLLLVIDSLDIGGAERHLVGLAAALVREGHQVTIACSIAGPLAPLAERAGVTVRVLRNRRVKRRVDLGLAQRLAALVRHQRFDLMNTHMYASNVAAAIATSGTSVPLVVTEQSQATWRGRCARWWSRLVYRRAAHLIAVSEAIRQRLITTDGVPATRITVIRNSLAPLPVPQGQLAAVHQLRDRGRRLVGVVARLQPEKGVRYFLEAAARLVPLVPTVDFLVVGEGPERQVLSQLAQRLGIERRIHFLGLRHDAPAIISLLDVLVMPSLSEGTPLVVLEAMAAGVPVVASAVGGIPEQIHSEREGVLVPPANPIALGAALLDLLCDPVRARRLGDAGRRRLDTHFSATAMLQQTLSVYHAVLDRPDVTSRRSGNYEDALR